MAQEVDRFCTSEEVDTDLVEGDRPRVEHPSTDGTMTAIVPGRVRVPVPAILPGPK
jgi:hypothetical protein